MRVLLLTHRYPPDGIGGVERYVESVAAGLAAAGDEVTVLTRRPTHFPRRPSMGTARTAGEHVLVIEGSGVRLDDPLARHTRLEQLFSEVLTAAQPEVVHVNHLLGFSPKFPVQAKAAGAALVVSLHDYYFACPLVHLQKASGGPCDGPRGGVECAETCFVRQRRAWPRWTLRADYFAAVLRTADCVLAPSRELSEYFCDFVPGLEPLVLPLGVDAQGRHASEAHSEGVLRLLVLGTVAPHKAAHFLLDALARADIGPVTVTLAGPVDDPDYGARLAAAATKLPRVELLFTGPYERDELLPLLAACDVVVFPSIAREVYPLVPREALAAGVPVVATRTGALDEHEAHGGVLLVEPANVEALAVALRRLRHEQGLLERMAAAAAAMPVVTASAHLYQLRKVYEAALTARSGHRGVPDSALFEQLAGAFR